MVQEQITSKDNRMVKTYVRLSNSRSYRRETNLFVAEGVKLILEAHHNGASLQKLFITVDCIAKHPTLNQIIAAVPTFEITPELERKMTSQQSPQGILAICEGGLKVFDITALKGRYILLCDLQDPGNVGTIIRTAEAVGIDGVIVSRNTCDLLSPKVLRASMGSLFRMPVCAVDDVKAAVEGITNAGATVYASVVDSSAPDVRAIDRTCPMVMLIGNEGNGIPAEIVERCHPVTIHMAGNAESLNASMAACILMWEMCGEI